MKAPEFRVAVLIYAFALPASPGFAVTYTANFLNTSGHLPGVAFGIAGNNIVGQAKGFGSGTETHALLWNSAAAGPIDLNRPGSYYSEAVGVSDTNQVGWGADPVTNKIHALLWSGAAASAIDLHPALWDTSQATGVSGGDQVGFAITDGIGTHAFLWHGNAASAVDLTPPGHDYAIAVGISGTNQIGWAHGPLTLYFDHAILWHGTAESAIDLHPVGATSSHALGTSGSMQVGYVDNDATLWTGSAASAVNLEPPNFAFTLAKAVSSAGQVGWGQGAATGDNVHALLWDGTAVSVVDLHPLLAGLSPTLINSYATGISDNGIIVGYAIDASNIPHPVIWTPVPEPTTSALFVLALVFVTRLRRS